MNKLLTIFILSLLCLSPTMTQFKSSNLENNYKDLNESVKAVFSSVLETIDSIRDSSDDSSDERGDKSLDVSHFTKDTEGKGADTEPTKVDDLLTQAFGKDNRFLDELVEMVAVSIENIYDHAGKFVIRDEKVNITGDSDLFREDALEDFRDFRTAITGMIDDILDASIRIDNDEYIVSDKDVNKLKFELENKEKEAGDVDSEEIRESRAKTGLKNGLKTISFIKSKLAKKAKEVVGENRYVRKATDKILRRQNALRKEDFERYLDEDRGEMALNAILD